MSRRHGRAIVPFGPKKGVEVRLLQNYDLSSLAIWLAEVPERAQKFDYLFESIKAEMRHRGLNDERLEGIMSENKDVPSELVGTAPLALVTSNLPKRLYRIEEF